MEFLGLSICKDTNEAIRGKDAKFSTDSSKVEAWVIPTNEELLIARDTQEIVSGLK